MEPGTTRQTATSPRIAYQVHGEAGTPVLLIMGLAMRGLVWRHQLVDLLPRHLCVTYDHRGLGQSAPAERSFSMGEMASDALRVLDELGWDQVHVVGASMGGMVAQHVALAAPGRLRSLTLVVTHPGGPLAWLPGRRGLRGLATAWSRDPNRRARGLATMLYPDRFVTGLSAEAFTDAMRDRTEYEPPQRTVLRQMRAVRRHDTRRQLCNIKAPTLVIKAGRDVLVRPAHSDKLAAAIPGASLLCYRDAGHGVLYQRARELNQAVLEHLAAADQRIAARSTP